MSSLPSTFNLPLSTGGASAPPSRCQLAAFREELVELAFALNSRRQPEAADLAMMVAARLAELLGPALTPSSSMKDSTGIPYAPTSATATARRDQPPPSPPADERELIISRDIDAPRERVFRLWTTRLPEWWGPHGMTTPVCDMDLRPGGHFRTVMRSPDGTEYPTRGVFLDVVAPERIVFTDAFDAGWRPHPDLFFTAVTTFEELPRGRTRLIARARHWTLAAREEHERMGFHHGWGESLDRLAALAAHA